MWRDMVTYWAWCGDEPPPADQPERKRLDYETLVYPTGTRQHLCVGVWDGDKYTPLHRDEMAWHLKNGAEIAAK